MLRQVLGSVQEALIAGKCLWSTHCMHAALHAWSSSRAAVQVFIAFGLSLCLQLVRALETAAADGSGPASMPWSECLILPSPLCRR